MKILQLQFFFLFQTVYSYYLPCFNNSEQILNSNSLFTYKNGVYDIGDYKHPGGNKDLLKTYRNIYCNFFKLIPEYIFKKKTLKTSPK